MKDSFAIFSEWLKAGYNEQRQNKPTLISEAKHVDILAKFMAERCDKDDARFEKLAKHAQSMDGTMLRTMSAGSIPWLGRTSANWADSNEVKIITFNGDVLIYVLAYKGRIDIFKIPKRAAHVDIIDHYDDISDYDEDDLQHFYRLVFKKHELFSKVFCINGLVL